MKSCDNCRYSQDEILCNNQKGNCYEYENWEQNIEEPIKEMNELRK